MCRRLRTLIDLDGGFGGSVAALVVLAIGLVAGSAHAQVAGDTSNNVLRSCGNFSLGTDGSTLKGDCNAWTSTLADPSDTRTEVRAFTTKETGVSIDLDTQIRVESGTDPDGNEVVWLTQSNAAGGNFSSDCTGETLTVNAGTETTDPSMTLSATCTDDGLTNATSLEISQFLANGNGMIVWMYATNYD